MTGTTSPEAPSANDLAIRGLTRLSEDARRDVEWAQEEMEAASKEFLRGIERFRGAADRIKSYKSAIAALKE
ncbi:MULTISPECIES: hypothetical protein [unclassified Cryobacterium]|uniref:hypothetical protein n=1 Tax=unclassified Cryobacterium TaxID=2649013 RepID=UPI00106A6D47|nr:MULTISPECIES: hypothetical protein [unclassified Cryobacterium]TFB96560.1 hypothetical protein E3O39_10845 [Cryobacterium sp. MDB2-A-1]TFC12844.1 hypothetical protein E3O35_08005 [Cryobacterium sp. MDB2-A-2]